MKARITRGIAALATAVAAATMVVGFSATSSAAATGLQAYGISGNGQLMAAFWTDRPQVLDWVRVVGPLSGDTALIGIDFRVQDGKLYGVGNHGGIYTISVTPPEGTATKVSQLAIALHGTNFGVDFNPAANRLRVVSDTGQNLRHNVEDHTTVADSPLSATGIAGAAYTNNDLNGDTATTLFDLNLSTDQVVIQSPANNGLLAPTGHLGGDFAPNAGFDIFSDLVNGKTVSATGFAALMSSTGLTTLANVNILTGAATPIGDFPLQITDVAVALDTN
jgi:hypothetical protein